MSARHEGIVLVVKVEVRQVRVLHVTSRMVAQAGRHAAPAEGIHRTQHWRVQLLEGQIVVRSSRCCICRGARLQQS